MQREANTRAPPRIHFLGALDTVKSVRDQNLYKTGLLRIITHTRHAVALLEDRPAYSYTPYSLSARDIAEALQQRQTFLEAWFLGTHGNIGGACSEDGLSLWPLQWMLHEAKECRLVLEFRKNPEVDIPNPLDLAFPRNQQEKVLITANGISVSMWDVSMNYAVKGMAPRIEGVASALPFHGRSIFTPDGELLNSKKYGKFHI